MSQQFWHAPGSEPAWSFLENTDTTGNSVCKLKINTAKLSCGEENSYVGHKQEFA